MISFTKKVMFAFGFFLATSISNSYGNYIVSYMDLEDAVPYYGYPVPPDYLYFNEALPSYPTPPPPCNPYASYSNPPVQGNPPASCSNPSIPCNPYASYSNPPVQGNPPASCSNPPIPCKSTSACGKSFFSAEGLYWRVFERGLDICSPCGLDTTLPDGRIISLFDGNGKDPHFKWSPGFRVGGGYESSTHWAFACSWTHLNSDAKSSDHHSNHLKWHMNLNVVDLLTSYSYHFNECFTLRPLFGLRGASIYQKLRMGPSPDFTVFALSMDQRIIGSNNKENFMGIGPLFGLEASLKVRQGFSVYAKGAVSWIYGHNNIKFVDALVTFDVIDYSHVKKHFNEVLTVADAAFGILWEKTHSGRLFSMKLGFEHHQFFDYNRLNDSGDLSFDGITLGLGIGF